MQHRQVIVIWQCILTARLTAVITGRFRLTTFFAHCSALFNSLDDHLVIGGGFGVAVQLVDDTYSNHNPFHIEDYLLLKLKLVFIVFKDVYCTLLIMRRMMCLTHMWLEMVRIGLMM